MLTVMGSQDERIETIRALIGRLSNPDVALTEAKVLRGQLSDLLEPVLVPYHEIGDGPLRSIWSPEPSMWAAG